MSPESIVTVDMPMYCFDVIIEYLYSKKIKQCPSTIPTKKFPIFVTWKKDENLRGCIGTFSSTSTLHSSLSNYAIASAFRDPRFLPITLNEVHLLTCSVSLLLNFENAKNFMDWKIGLHGIIINFTQNDKKLSAVFLPEIALEKNWDHVKTIDNLMRKAGFTGTISDRDRAALSVERFQSEKISLSFEQYCKLKTERGKPIPLKNFALIQN